MVSKESWLHVTDNTNIRWIKVFHLYKGFHRKTTYPGFYVKGSARIVEPPRLEYKGFKYKYSLKGDISRLLFVRASYSYKYTDHSNVRFRTNAAICIKKKNDPKSKFLNGPISRGINRRKFLTLFKHSL